MSVPGSAEMSGKTRGKLSARSSTELAIDGLHLALLILWISCSSSLYRVSESGRRGYCGILSYRQPCLAIMTNDATRGGTVSGFCPVRAVCAVQADRRGWAIHLVCGPLQIPRKLTLTMRIIICQPQSKLQHLHRSIQLLTVLPSPDTHPTSSLRFQLH